MANEWNPNAPDLKNDFKQAHDNKKEVQQEEQKRDIVSKMEVDKLEKERDTPHASLEPTPPGGAGYTAEYQQKAQQREERIKYIKERMAEAQERLRESWDNSRS